jgi:2-polyprenyl-3-methyl-5-hydroxy-6-metoxy-1,4-benzoquinol methylase
MASSASLFDRLLSGRLLRRIKTLAQYLYYMALQRIHPALSLEHPAMTLSGVDGHSEADRSASIELHLESDANAQREFSIASERRRAFATNIPDKFRTGTCFICDGVLTPVLQIVNATNESDLFERAWCAQCDHLQYSVMPPKDWFAKWYAAHWDTDTTLEQKLDRRHPTARYCRRLAPFIGDRKLKILDLGAGYGEKTVLFRDAGHELHCTEATAARASYLRDHVTRNVYFGTLDDDPVREQVRKNGPYDLIFTYHVIEHIYNPRQELQLLREVAADGALFHLAIPELYKEGVFHHIYTLEHIASFSRNSAATLLRQIGFEPIVAKNDPFQYYSDYCQYLIGRKSDATGGALAGAPAPSEKKMARYLGDRLSLDRIASRPGARVTYRYQDRPPLTYRISAESKDKCRDVARHLPIRIYHRDLPLFWHY